MRPGTPMDRVVAIALVVLLPASLLLPWAWRRLDPGLDLALAYAELDPLAPYRAWDGDWWRLATAVEDAGIVDAWSRPARVLGQPVPCTTPDAWSAFALLSAGPDGVFQTDWDGTTDTLPSPEGDDLFARMELLSWHLHARFAPLLLLCAALVYRSARALRPIASWPRDIVACFLLGLALSIPLVVLARVQVSVDRSALAHLPGSGGSIVLTLLGAVTVVVLAVRRLNAVQDRRVRASLDKWTEPGLAARGSTAPS